MVRWKDSSTGRWLTVTGGRTRDEAMIAEARVREDLLQGKNPNSKVSTAASATVSEVVVAFYSHSTFLMGSARWQKEAKAKIKNDIEPRLGKLSFAQLNQDRIYKFYLGMKEDPDRCLSNASLHKYHDLLCILGDVFSELFPSIDNPLRKIRNFRQDFPSSAPTRDINFLTPEELDLIFPECRKASFELAEPFARFQAATGLRRSEAIDLKWTDIDRASGFIHIRKSKNGRSRIVPLEPQAWAAIQNLQGRGSFVFLYQHGKRPHRDSYLRPIQRAARRAGITKRIDIHTLRHSYGSNKLRQGWGLKKVSMMLGHSDIQVTAKIYAHLLDGDLKLRDEHSFDFDNSSESEHIGKLRQADEKMAQILAQTLTSALAGTAEGRRALLRLVKSLPDAPTREISHDLASSSEISRDLQAHLQNGLFPASAKRVS